MKKLILLLALALGVEVKGQIVGGFLPINSSKSFTAGNSTFSNVIARGTLSVGSTATVTGNALFRSSVGIGALPTYSGSVFRTSRSSGTVDIGVSNGGYATIWIGQSTPNETNYSILGDANNVFINGTATVRNYINNLAKTNLTSTGLRVGSGVTPTAVLDVTGDAKVSSTFSLGSANLTGGNTGTVAVLSNVVFPITLNHSQCNPSDASTYYIGNAQGALVSNSSYAPVILPYNCQLVSWQINWYGVPGTSETSTLSINGTTTLSLLSNATFSNASSIGTYSASGLSNNFNSGDLLNVKWITPTWGTNPSAFFLGITLWFVRRS